MKIDNGTHRILFSNGKLYLDGVQIAGDGIAPQKDVVFEFEIKRPLEEPRNEEFLNVNVSDKISSKDIGPGQG